VVLVDAPCSGLGTLRRNPDLKYRQTPESLAELNIKQANILQSAARLVKTGGRLVYATCSLLSSENDDIVNRFLAAHPLFSEIDVHELLPPELAKQQTGKYLRLTPDLHNTDGFFAAVFQRGG
jgi:16S rRNA (cytosine967-C5)-methyltransferase